MNWTQEQWNTVIFSDESKFDVSVGDHRSRVIRNKQEAFHPDCIKRTVKFAEGLMVWGCISNEGVGQLHFIEGIVNAQKYQEILRQKLLPSIEKFRKEDILFQQDGASSHTAKTTKKWLEDNHIRVLQWPSGSPDLSPIENIWGIMKKELRNRRPRTKNLLKVVIQQVWDNITQQQCQNLYNTMNRRLRQVIEARGDVSHY